MPSVKLSPLFNDAQLDDNGLIFSGGKVYWYLAGTTTPSTTYSDISGSTAQSNPVVLNIRGEPDNPIWLSTGQAYKAILKDSLDNTIRTVDNISGINDTSAPIISEWVLYPGAASYINTTTFSVTGDQRATFTDGRRVKATVSGVDKYATINGTPVYGTGTTTVVLTIDGGGVLDSSLNSVYYGFLDPAYPSFDTTGVNANTKAGIQSQTWTAFTTGGASGAYTLTPSPAISSLSAGQRFRVKFHVTGNGTDTLNVSGLGAKSIKQFDANNEKSAPQIFINQLADIEYDGTDFVILNPIKNTAGTIIQFAGDTPPVGYLACPTAQTDVLQADYPALYAAVGTKWNGGSTPGTHFGLPWFPAGYAGLQGGTVGTATTGEVKAHTHTVSGVVGGGTGLSGASGSGTVTGTTGSTGGVANLAAGHYVKYCVKY